MALAGSTPASTAAVATAAADGAGVTALGASAAAVAVAAGTLSLVLAAGVVLVSVVMEVSAFLHAALAATMSPIEALVSATRKTSTLSAGFLIMNAS